MSLSRSLKDSYLYEFDQGFEVSYIHYSPRLEHLQAQLLVTLERGCERRTFAFYQPEFSTTDKNIVTSEGIYIAVDARSGDIEVGDIAGGFIYFTAQKVRNITPGG